ncbi:MAG TPA: PD-(D/E)XK nuclease family protein [Candidatus Paceibacterota bacterium]|nr:PD-(D/E)XK nuclease family protein [Candidatus Paceibacterota bacterium]
MKGSSTKSQKAKFPIKHWSHSSLMSFLRNPLAWHKRYVELVYDMPSSPAGVIGRAAHKAVEHYYSGIGKEGAIELGLEYLRNVSDFEINFGKKVKSKLARRKKRESMEREYLQAITFYLEKPPKHDMLGIEVSALAKVQGLPLPIKAVSDLVVVSKVDKRGVDIIDHKFVAAFSPKASDKALFVMQAIFNYYTVKKTFGKPVRRFIVYECKITRNMDGSPQVRKYIIDFRTFREEFIIFHRLLRDATKALQHTKVFLPNPSDIFEGENSFDIYRINLPREEFDEHFRPDN